MFRKDFLSMWSLSNTLNKWSNREGLTTKSSKGTVDLGFGKFERKIKNKFEKKLQIHYKEYLSLLENLKGQNSLNPSSFCPSLTVHCLNFEFIEIF